MKIRAGAPAKDLKRFVESQRLVLEEAYYLLDFADGFVYAAQRLIWKWRGGWSGGLRKPGHKFVWYLVVLEMPEKRSGLID